jgi:hypothetical protein
MRTTIDLDEDILVAVKELARRQSVSAGRVLSDLARKALTRGSAPAGAAPRSAPAAVAGFRPFASRGVPVTNDLIDALRDAEGL